MPKKEDSSICVLDPTPTSQDSSGIINFNTHLLFFFFKGFIYLFLERGEVKEKEREKNINVWLPLMWPLLGTWPTTQACALTGNQTSDPLVCSLCSIH